MTAHILFPAWDGERPATTSPRIVAEVIRGEIGFGGLLLMDDVSMQALEGSLGDRGRAGLAAGCDIVLHCNGRLDEMVEIAGACPAMTEAADRRWRAASALRRRPDPFDVEAGAALLGVLLGQAIA